MNPADKQALISISQGVAQGALAPVHDIIRALTGNAASEAGGAVADQVRAWRIMRAARLAGRIQAMLQTLGLTQLDVPLKVLVPAVEAASLEDDDALQDRWAALIARGSAPSSIRAVLSTFSSILGQLSTVDALFLDALAERNDMSAQIDYWTIKEMFELFKGLPLIASSNQGRHDLQNGLLANRDFQVSRTNLMRLGLLEEAKPTRSDDKAMTEQREENVDRVSTMGVCFLAAVDPSNEESRLSVADLTEP